MATEAVDKATEEKFFNSKEFYIKIAFVIGFVVLVVIVYSKFKKGNG